MDRLFDRCGPENDVYDLLYSMFWHWMFGKWLGFQNDILAYGQKQNMVNFLTVKRKHVKVWVTIIYIKLRQESLELRYINYR